VASRLREDGLAVQTHVCVGDATRIVPAAVDELEADLLVLTSGAPPRAPSTLPIPVLTSGPRCRRSA
jgi:nucleotide-binding universal stress UspA family protein